MICEPVEPLGDAVELVLFDLDGTFADTAPDMAYALNRTLERNGRPPLPLATIRPHVSHGGIALIRLGFGIEPDHPEFTALRQQFLDIYRDNLTRGTKLFAGMEALLTQLEQRNIGWGIVTNKPGWLTEPLLQQLALDSRAACVVSGDTTANSKPHPEPIMYACDLLGAAPAPHDGRTKNLGYFARICPEKGFDLLVDAFIELKRRPDMMRPVNSSTIMIRPSWITYSSSLLNSA